MSLSEGAKKLSGKHLLLINWPIFLDAIAPYDKLAGKDGVKVKEISNFFFLLL